VLAGWYIPAGGNLNTPLACPAGKFCPGGGFDGTASIVGVQVVDCDPGTSSSAAGQSSAAACAPCAEGTFTSAAGSAACLPCARGWTSDVGSTSCASACEHPSAPASCGGFYTFAAADSSGVRSTTGCYFGSFATALAGGAWVSGTSTCTSCAAGTVSPGWAAVGDAATADACIATTLNITSLTCLGSTATVAFGGGESRAGVAPTSADLLDAQLELDDSDVVGGTLTPSACTAYASLGGVFACAGIALSEGYICTGDGSPPVGSLTVGSAAAFTCAGVGAVTAIFTAPGMYYPSGVQLVSPADMAFINAFAAPVGDVAPNGTLYPGDDAAATPQPGYCYVVSASSSVICYGFVPADGYGCASSSGAAPTLCAAGQYSNASSQLQCVDCGPGSYSASAGAAACAACPPGSGSITTSGNNAPSSCLVSAGFYISGAPDASTMAPCVANNYCPGVGAVGAVSVQGAGIVACPAGSSAPPGASAADQCIFPSPPPPPGGVVMSDLLSAGTNTSAMEAALASMSPGDASQAQASLLTQLSSMNTTGSGEAAASLVLAVVNAVPGVTLSVASQTAALSILQSVASGPINVTGGAAQSITGALSAVASAGMTNNPAALAAVAGVLTNLASSQASSLVAALGALEPGAPPPEPATTSSATIQTLVQIDPPGGSRLTTKNISAPGSNSSFNPMPGGLLPNDTAVVTQFFSLAFDPNGGGSAAMNTTGVTRLAFSNPDGSEIQVANASTPIRFALPRVDTSGDAQAVCAYFNPATSAYDTQVRWLRAGSVLARALAGAKSSALQASAPLISHARAASVFLPSQGCTGIPSPQPSGHTLMFVDGFTAANDTALALAWNISGPLVDGGLCAVKVIDCNDDVPPVVYPDPRNPLATPAVSCPPRVNVSNSSAAAAAPPPRQPVLRVFYGASCPLWRAGNAYNCSWNNIKQAFVGGGCVAVGDSTQCMCRHVRVATQRQYNHRRLPRTAHPSSLTRTHRSAPLADGLCVRTHAQDCNLLALRHDVAQSRRPGDQTTGA
jgi:hypothetical protein